MMRFHIVFSLSLQLPQSELDALDPNSRRFRLENGESLAEIDEVRCFRRLENMIHRKCTHIVTVIVSVVMLF